MQNNNCLFCEKQRLDGAINYPALLQTALFLKYNTQDEMTIDDLIKHSHKKWVIDYYEKSQEILDQEFLKKYYGYHQITFKLIDLTEYYKYRLDTPNMFMLPIFKLMKNYNKLRKEYHNTQIKYKLKILVPQNNNNKVDIKYTQILQLTMSKQEEEQQSLISLLNKFQPQQITIPKQIKSYTQQSNQSTTKLSNKPLIKQNEQASKKLKSLLNGEILQQQQLLPQQQQQSIKRGQSKSHSNIKFHTLNSVNINNSKKMSIPSNKSNLQPIKIQGQSKFGSQQFYCQNKITKKIKLIILQMIILFALFLLQVQAIYILHTKGISINQLDYFVIELNQTGYKVKSQIAHNGSFTISKLYNDSALFDIFVLDQTGYNCYLQAYYNSSWETECFFLFNSSQASLNNFEYQKDYPVADAQIYLVIDNTPFPQNGAYFADRLYLQLDYIQLIQPIPTYYQVTIKITIVFVGVLICFSIWCLILSLKYRKETKHKESIERNKLNNTLSPLKQYK
ncbi:unnamed protein product [Paramecium primaurelia]|uniref:Transmembrane protein n=1 Tax=Paramecium primaurelia TaxID=5886 RepID=A0A8S1JTN1_PARPR|nr:unnamed protein product [Paramecium primaurelia]